MRNTPSWMSAASCSSLILLLASCHDVSRAGAFAASSSFSFPRPITTRTSGLQQLQQSKLSVLRGGATSSSSYNPSPSATSLLQSESSDDSPESSSEEEESLALRGGSRAAPGGIPDTPPPPPTLQQYQKFAFPCLALWISSPLLSLVDTAFVGLSGSSDQSAAQLAALGPATTFFDGATYLFAFLNVATTNLYSSARAQSGEESAEAESVVRTAARVATNCGIGLMLFLLAVARPLLRLYIGDHATDTPGLLDSATDYVWIRSLSMPTSLLLGVLQAALLGAKDSVTPLIAIMYSTVVNIVGDFVLVNRLKMGLQGAAIATTAAQWAATIALIGPARQKLVKNHSLDLWKKKENRSKEPEGHVTGRAFLGFAAPVLTLILGKLAAFGFMTNAAAGVPGQPTPLASHQIILSLLFFCSPFLEVISQTAQTFLPPFLAPVNDYIAKQKATDSNYDPKQDPKAKAWLKASHKVGTSLLGVGVVTASVVGSLGSLVPAFFGNIITSDHTVQQAVKPLAKYLFLGTLFWAPVAVSEGILLARRELSYLAGVYLASTALLPPALLRVKFRNGDVGQVWACFVVFQIFRAICFTMRIWGPSLLKMVSPSSNKATTTSSVDSNAASQPSTKDEPESPPPPVKAVSPG